MININILPSKFEKNIRYGSENIKFSQIPDLFEKCQTNLSKDETNMYTFAQTEEYENHFLRDNLIEWHALVLDVDNDNDGKKITLLKAHKALKALKLNHVIATTHKHNNDIHRFRIIIELDSPVIKAQYTAFSYGIEDSPFYKFLRPDESSLDPARRWILPPEGFKMYTYFEGKSLSSIKYTLKGLPLVPLEKEKKPTKIFKNGYLITFTDEDEKPRKYYEKIIENREGEFHKGNRDKWLFKIISKFNEYCCDTDLAHELIDPFIEQLEKSTEKQKFIKMINKG